MKVHLLVAVLGMSLVVLAVAAFGGSSGPADTRDAAAARSLPSARLFMLLPDGKVEISDAWARRVYRWDGQRWVELEVERREPPAPRTR